MEVLLDEKVGFFEEEPPGGFGPRSAGLQLDLGPDRRDQLGERFGFAGQGQLEREADLFPLRHQEAAGFPGSLPGPAPPAGRRNRPARPPRPFRPRAPGPATAVASRCAKSPPGPSPGPAIAISAEAVQVPAPCCDWRSLRPRRGDLAAQGLGYFAGQLLEPRQGSSGAFRQSAGKRNVVFAQGFPRGAAVGLSPKAIASSTNGGVRRLLREQRAAFAAPGKANGGGDRRQREDRPRPCSQPGGGAFSGSGRADGARDLVEPGHLAARGRAAGWRPGPGSRLITSCTSRRAQLRHLGGLRIAAERCSRVLARAAGPSLRCAAEREHGQERRSWRP